MDSPIDLRTIIVSTLLASLIAPLMLSLGNRLIFRKRDRAEEEASFEALYNKSLDTIERLQGRIDNLQAYTDSKMRALEDTVTGIYDIKLRFKTGPQPEILSSEIFLYHKKTGQTGPLQPVSEG